MRKVALTEHERADTDGEHGQHFHHREHSGGTARRGYGRTIEQRDEPQCRQSHHGKPRERHTVTDRQCQPRLIEHSAERGVHEDGKSNRQRCLRACFHDGENSPAVEKTRRLAISTSQKDVVATRCWHHRGKLGVAEGTQQ